MKLGAHGLAACFRLLRWPLLVIMAAMSVVQAQDGASLKARHAALRGQLASNAFQRPMYLESSENATNLRGDVYALIEQPYTRVGSALQIMVHWCDILILHLNVKGCRAYSSQASDILAVNVGRKYDQPLEDAYLFEFNYKLAVYSPEYLQVVLNAEAGPFGTSQYRILMEVVALDARHSFLHLSYSYASGSAARLAARAYLTTFGRSKVGFSVVGREADGQPIYIGGTRGVIERNAMRFYLAIEAYLDALSAPVDDQVETRLSNWFSGIERYPVQLHELERDEYLYMKRKEIGRQQR